MTLASTGAPVRVSGWLTMYWSRGSSRAMSTASAEPPRRPARPTCCQNDERVPGQPTSSTASSPLMSIPSSRALVAARPSSRPERRSDSRARRSSGRYPPRYARTRSPLTACSRTDAARISTARRDRANVNVEVPWSTSWPMRSAASVRVPRKPGMGWSGSPGRSVPAPAGAGGCPVRSPGRPSPWGFHRMMSTAPRALSSTSTTSAATPSRRSAVEPGSATVAEAATNVGVAPCRAATRRRRRSTRATCDPKTPR